MKLTRRQALTSFGLGTVLAATTRPTFAQAGAPAQATGPISLPPLPYPHAALEPHIDAQTMEIHHGRHHQAYVNNLNAALKNAPELAKRSMEDLVANYQSLPENIRTVIRNNGGGHLNHVQFWTVMTPKAGKPSGAILDAINSTFGAWDKFVAQFNQAAITRFGSGWAWLSDQKGKLVVHSTANQDHPSMEGMRAIFGIDVWEHAYYLKYQNRRPDYVTAWWNVVNWDEVNRRLKG